MRILITGGFGFVGGRLAQHLLQTEHQVLLGTRKERASPEWLPNAEVVKIDWCDDQALEKVLRGVDLVVHAAGMNAHDCLVDPIAALKVNGLATASLLAAATRAGVRRFIYLSTAHVYSNPLIGMVSEESCPANLNPYATSHLAGETSVLGASQRGEIEGIVLRLSNAFGTPVHVDVNCWMLLVNDLCRQAVMSRKLLLRSSGVQQRNFITLKNLSCCLEHFILLPTTSLQDGLFNVGGDCTKSIYDMTLLVATRCQVVLGFTPQIETVEYYPEGNARDNLSYSLDKLKSTGYIQHGTLEDEIDSTLLFCLNAFGNAV